MISAIHVGGTIAPEEIAIEIVPWMKQAACRRTKDPDKFFRERSDKKGPEESRKKVKRTTKENTRDAKAICSTCSVASECLLWALHNDEEYGIWGGSTPDERRVMKRYMK